MCELARNSVLQSGWENRIKSHWIGKSWYSPGVAGNDMRKTNVPNRRVAFRHETLMEELNMLSRYAHKKPLEGVSGQQEETKTSTAVPLSANVSTDMKSFPGASMVAEKAYNKKACSESADEAITKQS